MMFFTSPSCLVQESASATTSALVVRGMLRSTPGHARFRLHQIEAAQIAQVLELRVVQTVERLDPVEMLERSVAVRSDVAGLGDAEATLRLRALRVSGDFDDYWVFHLAQEYERTHRSRYADGAVPNPLSTSRPRLTLVK
jgi:hypothetical protein